MSTPEEKWATLLTLYPLFKEEIYRRRHEMMRWTIIGAGSMLASLLVVLLSPDTARLSSTARMLLSAGVVLWGATLAMVLFQQRHRHREAKRTLIDLERALSLFTSDLPEQAPPLYPSHWQTDWLHDRSLRLSLTLLGLVALLVLVALWCRCSA